MLPGLLNDEKKVAALIVGEPSKKEEGPKEMVGLDAAAEDIISAVKSGDPKLLVGALKSFYEMCEMEEESKEEESEILEGE